MKFKTFLRTIASQSTHRQYKHAAVVAKGKAIYGFGDNSTHHAEVAALMHAGEHAEGATLYTLMVRRDGELGNGSPCAKCMEQLALSKVKKVVVYV